MNLPVPSFLTRDPRRPAAGRSAGPATAPPVRRTPMPAVRWFGFWRGLAVACWPGLPWGAAPREAAPWHAAAQRRRRVLLGGVGTLALLAAVTQALQAPAQPGLAWWGYSALLVLLVAWVGAGFITALAGVWSLWRGDRESLALPDARRPIDRAARTAVIMPVCNEDIATVFGGLRATCESLAATGALPLFDIYVLSDTPDPVLRAAEMRAWSRLRQVLGDDPVLAGGRVFYRWRRRRTRRKAGNVADFCRRWGRDYRYMVVLDADSTMHGETLVNLVRLMEAHPRAGIIQTLPQSCGHATLHARAQQFAQRVTGRLFSLGMAWWQLGDSHYWGHNAILRVEPFMRHCGLAPLPGRGGLAGEILSHDFVEAAMMARAGYEVWLAPDLGGSWEQNPPHLLDELQRDRRWCQGNLQNLRLVAEPGWRAVHRVAFATAAFSYAVAPLWLMFMALGASAGSGGGSAALWGLTLVLLLLPRALGAAAVIARGEQAAFGGTPRLLAGAVAEALISGLQAPVRLLAHTLFVTSALTGLRLDWKSPSRQADGVAWRDAWRRIGRPAMVVLPIAVAGLGLQALQSPAWWLVLVPLLLAVPQVVTSASPRLGAWADGIGLLVNPDDRRPPRPLARAADHHGFRDLQPAAPVGAAAVAGGFGRSRLVLACALAVFTVLGGLPRHGLAPELPDALRAQWQAQAATAVSPPGSLQLASDADRPGLRGARTTVVRDRPARTIDDALRQRALEAVERALQDESDREAALFESA